MSSFQRTWCFTSLRQTGRATHRRRGRAIFFRTHEGTTPCVAVPAIHSLAKLDPSTPRIKPRQMDKLWRLPKSMDGQNSQMTYRSKDREKTHRFTASPSPPHPLAVLHVLEKSAQKSQALIPF